MRSRRKVATVASAAALGSAELLATAKLLATRAAPAHANDINTYGGYVARLADDAD